MNESAHCENCRHSIRQTVQGPDGKIQIGEIVYSCRRLPPVPVMVPGAPYAGQSTVTLVSQFPQVTKDIVCAEHQFADADPDAADLTGRPTN